MRKTNKLVLLGVLAVGTLMVILLSTPTSADTQLGKGANITSIAAAGVSKLYLPYVAKSGSVPAPAATQPPPTSAPTQSAPTSVPTVAAPTVGAPTTAPTVAAPTSAPAIDPIVLATGDSRSGCTTAASQIATLLDTFSSNVPVLHNGDMVNTGAYSEFTNCFDTTYGRHKAQLKPVPGNHEYMTSGASGYYQYFGSLAGPAGKGYYSFNVGSWHIVNLNSEIDISASGAQVTWLKNDLAANPTACTLAMWHRPRWSSGEHGNQTDTGAMYQALYNANAEIVLSGHDHDYERFAPQNPSGGLDTARGIRQWILGTGGVAFRSFTTIRTNSQVRNNNTYGALKLTLHPNSYDWQYLPVGGGTLSDSGTTACH